MITHDIKMINDYYNFNDFVLCDWPINTKVIINFKTSHSLCWYHSKCIEKAVKTMGAFNLSSLTGQTIPDVR